MNKNLNLIDIINLATLNLKIGFLESLLSHIIELKKKTKTDLKNFEILSNLERLVYKSIIVVKRILYNNSNN
ncbi:MAG: hypothetical protein ACTSPD_12500 [Promethearchaeota archaeon]